jgi:hypothetical protein
MPAQLLPPSDLRRHEKGGESEPLMAPRNSGCAAQAAPKKEGRKAAQRRPERTFQQYGELAAVNPYRVGLSKVTLSYHI